MKIERKQNATVYFWAHLFIFWFVWKKTDQLVGLHGVCWLIQFEIMALHRSNCLLFCIQIFSYMPLANYAYLFSFSMNQERWIGPDFKFISTILVNFLVWKVIWIPSLFFLFSFTFPVPFFYRRLVEQSFALDVWYWYWCEFLS